MGTPSYKAGREAMKMELADNPVNDVWDVAARGLVSSLSDAFADFIGLGDDDFRQGKEDVLGEAYKDLESNW